MISDRTLVSPFHFPPLSFFLSFPIGTDKIPFYLRVQKWNTRKIKRQLCVYRNITPSLATRGFPWRHWDRQLQITPLKPSHWVFLKNSVNFIPSAASDFYRCGFLFLPFSLTRLKRCYKKTFISLSKTAYQIIETGW